MDQQFVPFLVTVAGIGAFSGLMGMIIFGVIDSRKKVNSKNERSLDILQLVK